MPQHNRETLSLISAVEHLRGEVTPFEAAKCTAAILLLRLISAPGNAYESLGLSLPSKLKLRINSTLTDASPATLASALEELESASHSHFGGLSRLTKLSEVSAKRLKDVVKQLLHPELLPSSPQDLLWIGEQCEHLLRQAALAVREAETYFSSAPLVQLMAALADLKNGYSVHDPTCGAGGALAAAGRQLAASGGNPFSLMFSGQDLSEQALGLCRLNLMTHGLVNFDLRLGDTLTTPLFARGDNLCHFDRVLNAPPWGLKTPELVDDQYNRFTYGPLKGRADVAFLQHALTATSAKGRTVIQLPNGVLFREAERQIRSNLVREGILNSIIALPTNILPYVSLPSSLIVFDFAQRESPEHSLEFVDARHLNVSWRDSSPTKLADILTPITHAVHNRQSIQGFACTATLEEISANDFNLLPNAYIRAQGHARSNPRALLEEVIDLEIQVQQARLKLDDGLAQLGSLTKA